MNIAPFGEIDNSELEEYYSGELQFNNKNYEIDLNFESKSIESDKLESISKFLETIDTLIEKAFQAISYDFDLGENSETAAFYLQHHLEEFSNEELIEIFGSLDVDKQKFMDALQLIRIGLYPEHKDEFAIVDIQFSPDQTNYLMAVTFDNKGELSYIGMDS